MYCILVIFTLFTLAFTSFPRLSSCLHRFLLNVFKIFSYVCMVFNFVFPLKCTLLKDRVKPNNVFYSPVVLEACVLEKWLLMKDSVIK